MHPAAADNRGNRHQGKAVRVHEIVLVCAAALAAGSGATTAGAAKPGWNAKHSPAVAARTHVIRANGHLVGYRSFGHGSPIVFIEGYAVSMDYWDPPVLDRLARTHRVVLYDHRGVGRSTGSLDGLSIKVLGDDGAALIKALKLRNVTVLGHSTGADVAQQLAVDHRDALARLVLAAGAASGGQFVIGDVAALQSLAPPFNPFVVNDLSFTTRELHRAYLRRILARAHVVRVSAKVQRAQWPLSGLWMQGGAWEAQASMHTPTLITVGNGDPLNPPENGVRLAQHIPGAKLVRFPGLHLFWAEHPARFTSVLNAFVRNHP